MGFILHSGVLIQKDVDEIAPCFSSIMLAHAANQSKAVEQDDLPTSSSASSWRCWIAVKFVLSLQVIVTDSFLRVASDMRTRTLLSFL